MEMATERLDGVGLSDIQEMLRPLQARGVIGLLQLGLGVLGPLTVTASAASAIVMIA